ncbi:hypothetical protein MRB53_000057 [Persea americana]|uniref:Uncharacterized protein n=1 Tax=Persea americana TaxID=3435 RepID=A0ACC2MMR2_PERAE|nr:hypothetical protein MRB53_000057 [Persea americana]
MTGGSPSEGILVVCLSVCNREILFELSSDSRQIDYYVIGREYVTQVQLNWRSYLNADLLVLFYYKDRNSRSSFLLGILVLSKV